MLSLACLLLLMRSAAAAPAPGAEPDLKSGANVIVNSEETSFTVSSVKSGIEVVKTSITILNENGKHHAKVYVPYDKLIKVDYIKGTSYDAFGKKIKTLKKGDITDVSAISDFSLFEDNRVKIADLTYSVYPYTVEFEYQTTTNNMLFYPVWAPLSETKQSVKQATFQVSMPKGMKLRYRESNLKEKVKRESTATHEVYTWQVNNLTPMEIEPYGPPMAELIPMVRTAPSDFEVQGYSGNMESWQTYGQWINKLNEGRGTLLEATKQKLQKMVGNAQSPADKVQKVYEYLQQNTRYVSIQLGIGGWQPFEATFVDAKGYGDCKALTNYTQAMLKEVGVASYHALIRAGDDKSDIITDFPSSQFNHVVLCVPLQQDTVWLECTSQIASVGYAGSFTGDRHALLITPEGGKLVKTPDYKAKDNVQKRTVKVKLDEKGNGTASILTLYTGLQQEGPDNAIHHMKPEEQRKWLYQQVKLPSFEINSFSFTQNKDRVPAVTEQIELSLRQFATLSGKRMFLTPNLLNKWENVPRQMEQRQSDLIRTMSFHDVDSVIYQLPVGYTLEFQPRDMAHTSEFGEYKVSTKVDGQQVTYIRSLLMHKGRYKRESYKAYVEFVNNIVKGDVQQVVFVKHIP